MSAAVAGRPARFHRIPVGEIEVFALSDGALELPLALFPDAGKPGADTSFGPGPFPIAINCFAFRAGGHLYLVDAGAGHWRGEPCGHLFAAMRAAGLDPASVDRVLLTHMHGDHAAGLRDDKGATFPKAELWVAETEYGFWSDPQKTGALPESAQATIQNAAAVLDLYRGRLHRFAPGAEIAPGITAVALPGHTPGHTGFRIESGTERLLIWADIVHVAEIQFPHPDWTIGFDFDGRQAVASRQAAFAEAAEARLPVAGMHLPFPGVGHVQRGPKGYRYQPRPD